jgi:small subunit ribosomal protein S11
MLINTLQGVGKLSEVIKRGEAQTPRERTKQTALRTSFKTISDSDLIKPQYIVFIQSSFNNTILSLSNSKGDIVAWASAGSVGFRKSRRSSNVAAQATGEVLARKALEIGIQSVDIHTFGLGFTKESALRGLHLGGLRFTHLRDITSMPHNGCRPPKKRRV